MKLPQIYLDKNIYLNPVFGEREKTMTAARQEAKRISETDDVAAALRYLVDSHSTNAAVDLVHAVMNAVSVKPARADKPVAFRMRHHLETDERDWTVLDIRFFERNKHPAYVYELLYPGTQPDELRNAIQEQVALWKSGCVGATEVMLGIMKALDSK